MKLNPNIQIKRTKKLFDNTYRFKVVILCIFAGYFRGNAVHFAQQKLKEAKKTGSYPLWAKKATLQDVEFGLTLCKELLKLENYSLRIESPIISFYTNNENDIKSIVNIDSDAVKYVSMPEHYQNMERDTVYVKKLDYGFKVTMGRTTQAQTNFIQWAGSNTHKIRMPKRCLDDLAHNHSWGGGHFYVKDDKTLTMVKMFLGNSIARVDSVVKLPKN
jgi:hypothetical protein